MASFTVGSVAAIINAVVAVLQFVLPNILILTLVATVSNSQSAATWSVVSRGIQSSNWPLLLHLDTAATRNVQLGTTIITLLKPITLGLVAIAAIVTPLGLYEDIRASDDTTLVQFVQQTDTGPFGALTPPRSELGFSRECWDEGGALPGQCPGMTTVIEYSDDGNMFNSTIVNDDYDRRIPLQLAQLYQSGLSSQPASVGSFFDITSRWYNTHRNDTVADQPYLTDSYYPIASVIGDDDVKLIEGLVVDTKTGGIGFRSHTVPLDTDLPYGAEWEEDILFFIPETACVDTNTTLELKIPGPRDAYGTTSQHLVDQGGFTHLSRHIPYEDDWYNSNTTQSDPTLEDRAYRAAWTINALSMYFFDVTKPNTNFTAPIDSHVGKRFAVNNSLQSDSDAGAGGMLSLATLSFDPFDGLISVPVTPMTFLNGSSMSNTTYMSWGTESSWPNPHDITSDNFTLADTGCVGFLSGDYVNATNIQVKCGIVMGPANKTEGSDSPVVEAGSVWTRQAYTCASATKATIKTVRFTFNQTRGEGLERLAVASIADKQYASDAELPTWGIETPNKTLIQMTPLWGLVDPEIAADAVNLTMIQAPHMYIPASSASIWHVGLGVDTGSSYMPATDSPAHLWQSTYGVRDSWDGLQDLSGRTSFALASTWKNMSTSPAGTATMMNLIWTDLAANALVGTRGWLSTEGSLPPNLMGGADVRKRDGDDVAADGIVPVRVYQRVVRYRWVYGVPAALCLLLAAVIGLAALIAVVSRRGSVARIRYYANRLSAGRLLVALKHGEHDYDSEAKDWLVTSGSRRLSLPASGYASVAMGGQVVVEAKRDGHP